MLINSRAIDNSVLTVVNIPGHYKNIFIDNKIAKSGKEHDLNL